MTTWRAAQLKALAGLTPEQVLEYIETADALSRADMDERLTAQRRQITNMLHACGFHAAARKVAVKFDQGVDWSE